MAEATFGRGAQLVVALALVTSLPFAAGDSTALVNETEDTLLTNESGDSTTSSSDDCADLTLCAGTGQSTQTDCWATTENGTNEYATYAATGSPLTYSAVEVFNACSTDSWWDSHHGWYAVQHFPGGNVSGGMYTLHADDEQRTEYYLMIQTTEGGIDLRWSGEQSPTSQSCTLALAATAPLNLTLGPSFPCDVPPPSPDETAWMVLLG